MPEVTPQDAAQIFLIAPETVQNWIGRGYIHAYRTRRADGTLSPVHVDTLEIEAAFKRYGPKKMRDGRKKFGGRVVVRAEVVTP